MAGDRTFLRMPWPRVWRTVQQHNRWALPVGAALSGIFLVVGGLARAGGDSRGWLALGVGAGLTCVFARNALAARASARRGGRRAQLRAVRATGQTTTFLPYTWTWEVLTYLDRLFLFSVLAGIPLVFTTSQIEVSPVALFIPLAPVAALGCLPYFLGFLFRGFRRVGVGMTPEGVYHWDWFGCSFYAWDEIRYVVPIREHRVEIVIHLVGKRGVDHEGQYERVPEESWLNKYQWYRNRASRIHAGHLAVDPALMLEGLAFYHGNPELRAELGTTAAVSRFHQNAFPVNDWS